MKRRLGRHLAGWLIMLPGLALFFFYVWFPLIQNIVLSFFNSNGTFNIVGADFVGWDNYAELFDSTTDIGGQFQIAFGNTFKYLGWSLLIGFILPLIIGLLLSEVVHLKALFRIGIYFPAVLAGLTVAILFTYLFDPGQNSMLNSLLQFLGFGPSNFLSDSNLTIPLIVVSMTWKGAGATALIYLASFQTIDRSLYEAARIDGCGVFKRIWHITIPQILPTISTLFILQVISVMQVIYEPLVMTNGGEASGYASLSLLLLSYNIAWGETVPNRFNLASANSVILFLIILAITGVYFAIRGFVQRSRERVKKT
ncbi:MAG: sugar ABC transporter permease [Erysipelotrichaceae bacterium]|jgi:multiple sugar transport system permease protein|nr:sugar ABC transporter permease [Erysipelotrichaceae bacterium]